jgi:hypothetical protein
VTIICVKDGAIAADGACWYGGVKAEFSKLKIVRSRDGALGGSVGDASYTEFFRVWFAGTGAREERGYYRSKDDPLVIGKDEKREFRAMWLEPDGDVIVLESDGRPYLAGRESHAIGAAQEMAMGAMYAGASAERAVRICVERSDAAGGDVFVERLASVEQSAEPGEVQAPLAESRPASEAIAWSDVDKTKQQAINEAWREKMGLA